MGSLRQRLSIGLLALASALPVSALEWKEETISVTTAPFQTVQEAVFEFTNTGDKPVTILEVKTYCDCLEATANQKIYEPGATGVIRAKFRVGDRAGVYGRDITVSTDETPYPIHLRMRIEIPEVATLSPRIVSWGSNEPTTEKSIDLQTAPNLEIAFSEAVSTSPDILARLETITAGHQYRIHLKPRRTDQPVSAAIRINGCDAANHSVVLSVYANVH